MLETVLHNSFIVQWRFHKVSGTSVSQNVAQLCNSFLFYVGSVGLLDETVKMQQVSGSTIVARGRWDAIGGLLQTALLWKRHHFCIYSRQYIFWEGEAAN